MNIEDQILEISSSTNVLDYPSLKIAAKYSLCLLMAVLSCLVIG